MTLLAAGARPSGAAVFTNSWVSPCINTVVLNSTNANVCEMQSGSAVASIGLTVGTSVVGGVSVGTGVGSLTVNGGSSLAVRLFGGVIGSQLPGTATVTGNGSLLTFPDSGPTSGLSVGIGQHGSLTVESGGTVNMLNGGLAVQEGELTILSSGAVLLSGPNNGMTVAGNAGVTSQVQVMGNGSRLSLSGDQDSLSLGFVSQGTLIIGSGGVVSIDGGSSGGNAGVNMGGMSAGNGILQVTGNNSRLSISGDRSYLTVGNSGLGTLTVSDGALVQITSGNTGSNAGMTIGNNSAHANTVKVSGTNSQLVISGDRSYLTVGNSGQGSLTIDGGGAVAIMPGNGGASAGMTIGGVSGGDGGVHVTGNGSRLSINGDQSYLNVGQSGQGILTVDTNGTVQIKGTSAGLSIGSNTGSANNTVHVTGAQLSISGDQSYFDVGQAGQGTLIVDSGALVQMSGANTDMTIGSSPGGSGTVHVTGSQLSVSGNQSVFVVGNPGGRGELTIDGGGSVSIDGGSSGKTFVGFAGPGGTGNVHVVGANSMLAINASQASFVVGWGGAANLVINEGGVVSVNGPGLALAYGGGTGTIAISGVGSQLKVAGNGAGIGIGNGGQGTLTIDSGGVLTSKGTGVAMAVGLNGGTGAATVTGAGSAISLDGDNSVLNVGIGGQGNLVIDGGNVSVSGANAIALIGHDGAPFGLGVGGLGGVTLQNGGTLWVSGDNATIYVGYRATGTLTVGTGGKVVIDGNNSSLTVGLFGGTGSLIVDGGTVSLAGTLATLPAVVLPPEDLGAVEIISSSHSGTVNQSGGTHTVAGLLKLAAGSPAGPSFATFNLSGGLLNTVSTDVEGSGDNFIQTGGIHSTATLGVGGSYSLMNGILAVTQSEVVSGSGSLIQIAGSHSVGLAGAPGFLTILGGTVVVGTGALQVNGGLTVTGFGLSPRTQGTFSQFGESSVVIASCGDFSPACGLQIGTLVGTNAGTGVYNLADSGSVSINGMQLVSNTGHASLRVKGDEYVGMTDTGVFNQSGSLSTHTVDGNLFVGWASKTAGTYNLNGGTLTVTGKTTVGQNGNGVFNQSGGTHTVAGELTIANLSGSTGAYNLSGGSLSAQNITVNANGRFAYSGGTVSGDLLNNGTLNISGDGTRTLGNVENHGTVKVTGTTVKYTGTFNNNSAYVSDPADNYFVDLVVGTAGYLQGGPGDRFFVAGDFLNQSTQSLLWDTGESTLIFDTAGTHSLALAAPDLGTKGSLHDFSWGELEIGTGATLLLVDGNSAPTAALYVHLLAFAGGVDPAQVIASPFNIYYDRTLAGNDYLRGQSFALSGGGILAPYVPAAVPEPTVVLLLSTGLLGIVMAGLRKGRRQAWARSFGSALA